MARPPSGTDLKLKAAGKQLLQEYGIAGLSVRGACRLAGVNTGMFHYYFGSKDEFIKAVLKEMYAEFMTQFYSGTGDGETPRERLKNALVEIGKFARSLKKVMPLLFADMAQGKKEAFQFVSGNFTDHIKLVATLAAECLPASAIRGSSVPFAIAALVPTMVFPVIMGETLARNGVGRLGDASLADLETELLSDAGIALRAEIALRGIGL